MITILTSDQQVSAHAAATHRSWSTSPRQGRHAGGWPLCRGTPPGCPPLCTASWHSPQGLCTCALLMHAGSEQGKHTFETASRRNSWVVLRHWICNQVAMSLNRRLASNHFTFSLFLGWWAQCLFQITYIYHRTCLWQACTFGGTMILPPPQEKSLFWC